MAGACWSGSAAAAVPPPTRCWPQGCARRRCARPTRLWQQARKGGRLPGRAAFDLAALSAAADSFLVAVSGPAEAPAFRYVAVGPALAARFGQAMEGAAPEPDGALGSLFDGYRRCVRTGMPTYEYTRYRLAEAPPVLFERLLLPLSDDGAMLTHLAGIALFVDMDA